MLDVYAAYGLSTRSLDFVPVGYAAACYVVEDAAGERALLKLWPDTNAARPMAARLPIVLPLLRAIHEHDLGVRVAAPFLTHQGRLWAESAGLPFALFPFLTGRTAPPWPALPPALRDEFARAVAAIHRATPALADVLPPADDYALPFEADLQRGLGVLERDAPRASPVHQALRALIWPRRDEILAQLDRARRLRASARRQPGPLVLCHTDLGGDNMLMDDQGHLFMLDWDNASVGPPEFDLWDMLGDGFARFLEIYQTHGGAVSLHRDRFAFALLRRALGDMTARLVRLLEEPVTPEEEQEALAGIETWGFERWAGLDERLTQSAVP